jgi:methyl-accepting chemotaxis protein
MFFEKSIGKRVSFIVGLVLIISLSLFTLYMAFFLVNKSKTDEFNRLESKTHDILSLIELEDKTLKSNTSSNFEVLKFFFNQKFEVDFNKKISINGIETPTIYHGGEIMNLNFNTIDKYTEITNSVATIFVKDGNDFVRISTSQKKEDGSRAIGTFLTNKSPAYESIMNQKEYIGRTKLFGKEYMSKYSPILNDKRELVGILFMGYNIDSNLDMLKEALHNIKIGETGYVYVIGTKGENKQKFLLHPKLEGKSIVNIKDADGIDFFAETIEKKNGKIRYRWKESNGEIREKIAGYRYYKDWDWLIFASSYESEFLVNTYLIIKNIVIVSIILVFVLLISTYFLILILVSKPAKELKDKAMDLAKGDGNLTSRLDVKNSNELGVASLEINHFIEKVQNIITDAKSTSDETSSIANELNSTILQIANRVEEEAKLVDDTVKSGYEMKSILDESIQKAKHSKDDIESSKDNLSIARDKILKIVSDINTSAEIENELSHKLNQLSSDAEQVKSVLTIISDIADQTNLLALNAAIEAARAGEHGRGFAVVADEVRQLAERTQKSLNEINTTINLIVQSIIDASGQMFKNANSIKILATNSIDIEQDINKTFEIIQKSTELANENLITTKLIVKNSQDRIKKVEYINSISSSNARSIEETSLTVNHLHKMIEKLNLALENFKV